jgi:hypothetical protein
VSKELAFSWEKKKIILKKGLFRGEEERERGREGEGECED